MNLKTLITLGFVAMLALLLAIGGYAYYTVHGLDRNSRNVLKDNFYSVELGQQMQHALDQMEIDPNAAGGLPRFRQSLTREAGNITEVGEKEVVDSLTQNQADFQRLLDAGAPAVVRAPTLELLRQQTYRMVAVKLLSVACSRLLVSLRKGPTAASGTLSTNISPSSRLMTMKVSR